MIYILVPPTNKVKIQLLHIHKLSVNGQHITFCGRRFDEDRFQPTTEKPSMAGTRSCNHCAESYEHHTRVVGAIQPEDDLIPGDSGTVKRMPPNSGWAETEQTT